MLGGEYTKAAKSSETMAFDCPLACPEILEGLQGVSKEHHSAASLDCGGLTIQEKVTQNNIRIGYPFQSYLVSKYLAHQTWDYKTPLFYKTCIFR